MAGRPGSAVFPRKHRLARNPAQSRTPGLGKGASRQPFGLCPALRYSYRSLVSRRDPDSLAPRALFSRWPELERKPFSASFAEGPLSKAPLSRDSPVDPDRSGLQVSATACRPFLSLLPLASVAPRRQDCGRDARSLHKKITESRQVAGSVLSASPGVQ